MTASARSDLFSDEMTIREARDLLRTLVDNGHACPVCTQFAKVYRRKINTTMAATLLKMYRAGARHDFVHTPSLPGDTHEASQLEWWGLIEEEARVREDGGRAGWWRLTELGVTFAHGDARLPKYARVYDHRLLNLVGDLVSIHDCLGSRFNYRELMYGL